MELGGKLSGNRSGVYITRYAGMEFQVHKECDSAEIGFYLHKEFRAAEIRFYLHKEFPAAEIGFSLHKEFHEKKHEKLMVYLKIFRAARANLLRIS